MQQYQYNLGIRFKQIVDCHGERTALWFGEQEYVTYHELDRIVNRITRLFRIRGVVAGDIVAIAGNKTVYIYAALLACIKLGAPYVMLDPDSPVERLRKILVTCRPRLILSNKADLDMLAQVRNELDILAEEADELATRLERYSTNEQPQLCRCSGATPAYIMYTSGSTGFPKGAVMTHANVINLIAWGQDTFGITHEDTLTNVNPLYFDNSVFDFYTALFSGACLVPFDKDEVRDPRRLVDKVAAAGCSVWFSVPSLLIFLQTMRATDGKNLSGIRTFIFGGEGYPKARLKQLYDTYKGSSRFFNVYGPTECTCICSSYPLTDEDFQDVQGHSPLGCLADNFDFLILDDGGNCVPDGEAGELCLLGPNVGLGYYNDPERTATSFVQNPCNNNYREIMYRTGDLVRQDINDGKLYIRGRKDNQIKHMGYRIELEEIEAALYCLDGVAEAVVLHSMSGNLSRLIAVLVLHKEQEDEHIKQNLRKIIPDYMVPSTYYREERLPKNPNGKVDRRQLQEKYVIS